MNFQSSNSHSSLLFRSNHILKLEGKILKENILFISKSFNKLLPPIFKSWFTFCSDVHNYHTVSSAADKIFKPSYTTASYGNTPIFDHAHSITIKVTLRFFKYVLACKNLARFIHSLKLESHAHFWPQHPKIIKVFLNFPKFASAWKINSFHPFTLWPGWTQPFLTTPTPIVFYQILISGINI